MNVMKETKDEWAKREIERRMIEERERRERQRKMEEGGKGRGGRGGEGRGLLVSFSPVSLGGALEEVGRMFVFDFFLYTDFFFSHFLFFFPPSPDSKTNFDLSLASKQTPIITSLPNPTI